MSLSGAFNRDRKPVLDLAVYDTDSLQGFHDKMEEALMILSQSDYARTLAQAAIDADYTFVVEDAPLGETPEQFKTRERGSVDHQQRIVFVRKDDDVEMLALTILHELAHISQCLVCNIKTDSLEDHPLTLLQKLLMMEADARAQEVAFALSLKDLYPDLLTKVAAKAESKMVDALVANIKETDDTDKIMAERYKIYFSTPHVRRAREDAVLSMMERLTTETLCDATLFCKTTSSDILFGCFDKHGLVYLEKNKSAIDPDNDFFQAISAENFQRLKKCEAVRRENKTCAEQPLWDCFIYQAVEHADVKTGLKNTL